MEIPSAALFTCIQVYLSGLQWEMEAADLREPPHMPIVGGNKKNIFFWAYKVTKRKLQQMSE